MNAHTPGPWRWALNEKSKQLQLCGGRSPFDLTVIDFERWGMNGATARFREYRATDSEAIALIAEQVHGKRMDRARAAIAKARGGR